MSPDVVNDFWFLPPRDAAFGQSRKQWFRKDDAFDADVAHRFGDTITLALAGGLREWDDEGALGTLARIIVLDQFTRNAFRGTAASFAGDALALAAAEALVDGGGHLSLAPMQRWFVYMPFEHAEDMGAQDRAVALFDQLARECANADIDGALDYAHRHRAVIERFGRFPHRNALLGRASTAEETAFLAQPGSRF